MGWLDLSLALLKAAPGIIGSIKAVETAIGAGNGVSKKAIVMSLLVHAPAVLLTAASAFIDSTVGTLKAAGALGTATEVATGTIAAISAVAALAPAAAPATA
jgi:hypothetical protein